MARQRGIFKMTGTLDDVTFYKRKDGYVAKVKTSISKERIATDPQFARMRENGQDFGRAGTAGKTLRRAFQSILLHTDSLMVSRLQTIILRAMQADSTNVRGQKNIMSGNPMLLKDFEFNVSGPLSSTVKVTLGATLSRTTGTAGISVPTFVPTTSLSVPAGATHYKFIAGVAAVDFDAKTSVGDNDESGYLPIDNSTTAPLTLSLTLPANVTGTIFQVVGIRFYLDDGGTKYPISNDAYNAMSIVGVDV